ncbi:acetylornithine deacetylase [Roseovarius sp. SK2]|uniref:acetylornithine deacetylase n=1 Tax=Roseovarius TaxID=74030 RepID=UPI00237B80F5|nr:acetylornithine deacetylase [Roseovarius sp. SK2]MDD9725966.1 acetylornithine deacetylase [Roseovarius sp. SK2]
MKNEFPYRRTIEILKRLVSFPTVSQETNIPLIDYMEDLLKAAGFETTRFTDPDSPKSGLMARIGGGGPGGVMLSAHSDVVPVEGQKWTKPPFELTLEKEKYFGRGTTDMKGFLASMLSLAERAGETTPEKPLMLAISYDEEIGCQGIRKMLPNIGRLGWKPDLCIVGEPTSMRLATGHKGKAAFRATCYGNTGHSALAPKFVNALHIAGDLLSALRALQDEYEFSIVRDPAYDIPYSTIHVGSLHGGSVLNIVPGKAELDFELRHLAADSLEQFECRLKEKVQTVVDTWRKKSSDADISITGVNQYPGLEVSERSQEVSRFFGIFGAQEKVKVAFGTEAGFFASLGIPTVVCGPGDMEAQGHKADEYITVEQLNACDVMMDKLMEALE